MDEDDELLLWTRLASVYPSLGPFLDSTLTVDQLVGEMSDGPLRRQFTSSRYALHSDAAMEASPFASSWRWGLLQLSTVPHTVGDATIHALAPKDALNLRAFTLVALNRARDYVSLAELAADMGHVCAAVKLSEIDTTFAAGHREGAPLGTLLLARLTSPRPRVHPATSSLHIAAPTPDPDRWRAAMSSCELLAVQLVIQSARTVHPPTVDAAHSEVVTSTWSPEGLSHVIDHGTLAERRGIIALLLAGDDTAFAVKLKNACSLALDPNAVRVMRLTIARWYELMHSRERREIARRVHAFLHAAGVTQKEFAKHLGTSASRVSTYRTGSVTPSASMMLRMEQVAARLSHPPAAGRQHAPDADDPSVSS